MNDARFEDGDDAPLRLAAQDGEGLTILSALLQDAVFVSHDIRYDRKQRQFAVLVNRFRWEDAANARRDRRGVERVRTMLVFDGVLAVKSAGFDPRMTATMVLLDLVFDAGHDGAGHDGAGKAMLRMSGGASILLEVEALGVTLNDVTRPYLAPSGKVPQHGI